MKMLAINSIKNVNNTLNRRVSFAGGGPRTNWGVNVPTNQNVVEGGLLTGFLGAFKNPFDETVKNRTETISKGLDVTI